MVNRVRCLLLVFMLALIMPLNLACGGGAVEGTKTNSPTDMTVLSISDGPVLVQRSGSQDWIDGKAGMYLTAGDRVKTEPDGSATIVFFEGSSLELKGETEIALTELIGKQDTSTTIKMKQEIGTTISRVKKLVDTASSYEIETPAATAGVRGTIFKVIVQADGTITVSNAEGLVFVTAQGKTIILKEKTSVTVKQGQEPGEPEHYVPDIISPTPTGTTTPAASPLGQIKTGYQFIPGYVWKGETIEFTYSVFNSGNLPISEVTISDNFGTPIYATGDKNGNSILDPGEIWYFTSHISTTWDGPDSIDVRVEASGKAPGFTPTSVSTFSIDIHSFYVLIDSPVENTRFTSPTQTITGRVGNPMFTEVILDVNGVQTTVPVVDMKFTGTITLTAGENQVWARVKTPPNRTDSSGYKLYYDP